jgi:hypothetical protein
MGNSSQGAVLPGQVQAVIQGAGISIVANGTISVDSQTVVGLMKLGQTAGTAAAAYNSYEWPTTTGTAGQQLTINTVGGNTTLKWDDPDQIPWTAKGQLLVGTGVNTQTLLNVGSDGSILIADSATTSGLNYTSNFVATTGSTGAANIPAGATGARPAAPVTGQFRFNTASLAMEYWNGVAWYTIPASTSGLFVDKTSATGSAAMPAGTSLQRDAAPAQGYTRFNSTNGTLEFWDGAAWSSVASSSLLGLGLTTNNIYTVTKVTEAAVPPTPGAGQTQAILGSTYYDTTLGQMFTYYSNGGSPVWVAV